MTLNGTTAFTMGQAGGAGESLTFADEADGNSDLRIESGSGGHVFNTRIDLWSNLIAVNNTAGPVTFNGDIVGQGRLTSGRPKVGALRLTGTGRFVLNGRGFYQGSTILADGVTLDLNSQLYFDNNECQSSSVSVYGGSRLELAHSLDQSFGGLDLDATKLLIDGGTIAMAGGAGSSFRAFTVGASGATIEVAAGETATLDQDAEHSIVSALGGGLTLTGAGTGQFHKVFSGSGGITQRGDGTWELHSDPMYAAATVVEEGEMNLVETTGTGATLVQPTGKLSGTGQVRASLVNEGIVSPGTSLGELTVAGDFTQHLGSVFHVELQGVGAGLHDTLSIGGTAYLDGALDVTLSDGYSPQIGDFIEVLTASNIVGTFELAGDAQGFLLLSSPTSLALYFGPPLPGDYDLNGVIDDADYNVWKASFGSEVVLAADGNNNGIVDAADYTVWRDSLSQTGTGLAADGDQMVTVADYGTWNTSFGQTAGSGAAASANAAVPEPTTAVMLMLAAAGWCLRTHRAA